MPAINNSTARVIRAIRFFIGICIEAKLIKKPRL